MKINSIWHPATRRTRHEISDDSLDEVRREAFRLMQDEKMVSCSVVRNSFGARMILVTEPRDAQ